VFGLLRALDHAFERTALLQIVLPPRHRAEGLFQVVRRGRREKADPADVHSENRHFLGGGEPGATEQGAVTPEGEQEIQTLAVQVAALAPSYVDADSIPAADLEARKAELLADEATQKKPENIRPQIVEGQLKKWYSQVCLYDQPFRDEDRTVRDLITEKISTIGENIRVRRFTRYALGEEL